jgi:lysine/ornithine N-monooxygenase
MSGACIIQWLHVFTQARCVVGKKNAPNLAGIRYVPRHLYVSFAKTVKIPHHIPMIKQPTVFMSTDARSVH